jgi:phospholipid/cholesterol/gamma-HCH transport system permease protein
LQTGERLALYIETRADGRGTSLWLQGSWRAEHVAEINREIDAAALPASGQVALSGEHLESVDLTGAWLIRRLMARVQDQGLTLAWQGPPPEALAVVEHVIATAPAAAPVAPAAHSWLETLGRSTVRGLEGQREALEHVGRSAVTLAAGLRHPARLRLAAVARQVDETGIQAMPIVALIAFLISVIVAYIGAQELRQFGGELFVVDLVTISVLRELGVLLTAIIVAGRSGSAFAAELGVMQLNDEVDALRAIGANVTEVLVNPRVLGLVIALPLLTIVADAMGLSGGAVLSWLVLDIPFNRFLHRMHEVIAPTTFWAGLLKAPVFAAVISLTATLRGLQVRNSSRELGRLTTVAVVQSIFLVLLVDALFSVLYWKLDL